MVLARSGDRMTAAAKHANWMAANADRRLDVYVQREDLDFIDALAKSRGESRAQAVRHILRALRDKSQPARG